MRSIICLLVITCCNLAHSDGQVVSPVPEGDSLQPNPIFNWDYIHSGFMDARDQVLSPLHWNGVQWMTAAALASTESILIFADGDMNIQIWSQKVRNNTTNFLENNIGDPFGNGIYPAVIIGSAYIIGAVFHKKKPERFAMLCAKSFVLSGITTEVIKDIAGRYRPFQSNPPDALRWAGPNGFLKYDSFPSGHTTIAFSTASMIALEYPKPLVIPILAYSAATLTAFGRINGNHHWASDVVMGAAIGYFTSLLVYNHNNWGKLQRRKRAGAKEWHNL